MSRGSQIGRETSGCEKEKGKKATFSRFFSFGPSQLRNPKAEEDLALVGRKKSCVLGCAEKEKTFTTIISSNKEVFDIQSKLEKIKTIRQPSQEWFLALPFMGWWKIKLLHCNWCN